jgi:hypothetical protein
MGRVRPAAAGSVQGGAACFRLGARLCTRDSGLCRDGGRGRPLPTLRLPAAGRGVRAVACEHNRACASSARLRAAAGIGLRPASWQRQAAWSRRHSSHRTRCRAPSIASLTSSTTFFRSRSRPRRSTTGPSPIRPSAGSRSIPHLRAHAHGRHDAGHGDRAADSRAPASAFGDDRAFRGPGRRSPVPVWAGTAPSGYSLHYSCCSAANSTSTRMADRSPRPS